MANVKVTITDSGLAVFQDSSGATLMVRAPIPTPILASMRGEREAWFEAEMIDGCLELGDRVRR